jgi:hypothetical protein
VPTTGASHRMRSSRRVHPPARTLGRAFPSYQGMSGHRLLICAFMIHTKVVYDDTHSNKSYRIGRSLYLKGVDYWGDTRALTSSIFSMSRLQS